MVWIQEEMEHCSVSLALLSITQNKAFVKLAMIIIYNLTISAILSVVLHFQLLRKGSLKIKSEIVHKRNYSRIAIAF